MIDELEFNNLEYGAYALEFGHAYMSENVKYASAEFNKLYVRRVKLPDGKNNIIFLLSDNFSDTLKMLNNDMFYIPPVYYKVFFPQRLMGGFMQRRYRLSLGKKIQQHKKEIATTTKFSPYPSRHISSAMIETRAFTVVINTMLPKAAPRFMFWIREN